MVKRAEAKAVKELENELKMSAQKKKEVRFLAVILLITFLKSSGDKLQLY